MSDLVARIEARLAAVEAAAKAAHGPEWLVDGDDPRVILRPDKPGNCWDGFVIARLPADDFGLVDHGNAEHIAMHDPAAELRMVAALRAAVALHTSEPMLEPCEAETWSIDHYGQAVDPYWIRCTRLGRHDEHEDSGNTGCTWPLAATDQAEQDALPLVCVEEGQDWPCPTLTALASAWTGLMDESEEPG